MIEPTEVKHGQVRKCSNSGSVYLVGVADGPNYRRIRLNGIFTHIEFTTQEIEWDELLAPDLATYYRESKHVDE